MLSYQFEATVEDDIIRIPEKYRRGLTRKVQVVLTPQQEKKKHTFAKPRIKTKGWKFDREEANAR
jgi:hypothetical protein